MALAVLTLYSRCLASHTPSTCTPILSNVVVGVNFVHSLLAFMLRYSPVFCDQNSWTSFRLYRSLSLCLFLLGYSWFLLWLIFDVLFIILSTSVVTLGDGPPAPSMVFSAICSNLMTRETTTGPTGALAIAAADV